MDLLDRVDANIARISKEIEKFESEWKKDDLNVQKDKDIAALEQELQKQLALKKQAHSENAKTALVAGVFFLMVIVLLTLFGVIDLGFWENLIISPITPRQDLL